jgi:hypothetical protein
VVPRVLVCLCFTFAFVVMDATSGRAFDETMDLPVAPGPIGRTLPKPPPGPVVPPALPPVVYTPPPPPVTFYGQPVRYGGSVAYVLDISGSMAWDEGEYTAPDGTTKVGNRLDRLKDAMTTSLASLPAGVTFNVWAYDCQATPCFSDLVAATAANVAQATAWVQALQPQGATGTGPAVVQALASGAQTVLLATDGAPNCGAGDQNGDHGCLDAHRAEIDAANVRHVPINVWGIGATGPFRAFCLAVASDNSGTYADCN